MDAVSTTVTIMTGLAQAIEITKNLRDADLKLNEAEHKFKIAELYNALSDIKMNIADLKSEVLEKNEKIQSLENQFRLETEVLWKNPFYFRKNQNDKQDGPFCQQCYDTTKQLIRIIKNDRPVLTCNTCSSQYDNPDTTRSRAYFSAGGDPYDD